MSNGCCNDLPKPQERTPSKRENSVCGRWKHMARSQSRQRSFWGFFIQGSFFRRSPRKKVFADCGRLVLLLFGCEGASRSSLNPIASEQSEQIRAKNSQRAMKPSPPAVFNCDRVFSAAFSFLVVRLLLNPAPGKTFIQNTVFLVL